MTKIVKNYVADKIRKGVEPKLKALEKAAKDAAAATPTHDDVLKAIRASEEYKALEAFIRKWAKGHNAEVTAVGYRSKYLMRDDFRVEYKAVLKAKKEFNDFSEKVDEAVRDAIVTMELSKSKADVDVLIAKALEALK